MERRFAGTLVEVNNKEVAKLTSFNHTLDISEAETTGSMDLVEGGLIYRQQFISTSVGETAALEGVVMIGDQGQSELKDVAEKGEEAVVSRYWADGSGTIFTGYFTAYEESGSVSDGVYTFSGTFRINSKEEIQPEE